ncbi:hypothetical protein DSO57_1004346 [Entomophthora muscae]|uniref:Uncharacterized protein n=1 Tax=Entomophthora muscae TaxID=34485 RepID=A0ACC2T873_9FUNG|nr:hypothetical protein DSO57_1004346 [Entomophthora muscae]
MDQNMIALDKKVEQLGSRLHQFEKYVLDNFQRLEAKVDNQAKVSCLSTPKLLPCLYSTKISTLQTKVATSESAINVYEEEFARAHETIMALQKEQIILRNAVLRLSKTTMSVESELRQRSLQMDNSNLHNFLARMEAQIQLLETKGFKCILSSWQTSSSMCTDHYEDAADTPVVSTNVEQLVLLLVCSKLQIDVSLANVLYLSLCKSTTDYNRIEL